MDHTHLFLYVNSLSIPSFIVSIFYASQRFYFPFVFSIVREK